MAKILVVDDEAQVRNMVKEMLLFDDHQVIEAENGQQGCELYMSEKCDVIITDLVMPEKSGIDLITDLKKINDQVKIIAISGGGGITGRFDYLPIAKLIGALVVINKPFRIEEIRDAIDQVMAVSIN